MSGVAVMLLGRDAIDRMLDSSNLYAYLIERSLLLLDPSGHVSISLDGINIDPGTTVRPRHSGCHCNMGCDSMKPNDVIVTPSCPGKNSRCIVKFVWNKCDLEGEGGEIGSAPDPIRNQ